MRPEQSSYFWVTVCSGTVFPSARCRATLKRKRGRPPGSWYPHENPLENPAGFRFRKTRCDCFLGLGCSVPGSRLRTWLPEEGDLAMISKGGLGARLVLPSRPGLAECLRRR